MAYTNSDIPALIAEAIRGTETRASNVRVNNVTIHERYNGDVEILSYYTRMALIIKGEQTHAVLNTNKYSRTTSKHMGLIRQGVARAGIFSVDFTGEPPVR